MANTLVRRPTPAANETFVRTSVLVHDAAPTAGTPTPRMTPSPPLRIVSVMPRRLVVNRSSLSPPAGPLARKSPSPAQHPMAHLAQGTTPSRGSRPQTPVNDDESAHAAKPQDPTAASDQRRDEMDIEKDKDGGGSIPDRVDPTSRRGTSADQSAFTVRARWDTETECLREATLGALLFYAEWSELCMDDFVPRAMLWLGQHPKLTDGVIPVDIEKEPDLCAYYGVRGIPCVVFRATPTGRPTWRHRGKPQPVEIPNTRTTGVCSRDRLVARTDAAALAFRHLVPPLGGLPHHL